MSSRLAAVRELMARAQYDALVVPRADEHLGEYIPLHSERLRWISGFTGSAGVALVLADRAGRSSSWRRAILNAWLSAVLPPGSRGWSRRASPSARGPRVPVR